MINLNNIEHNIISLSKLDFIQEVRKNKIKDKNYFFNRNINNKEIINYLNKFKIDNLNLFKYKIKNKSSMESKFKKLPIDDLFKNIKFWKLI